MSSTTEALAVLLLVFIWEELVESNESSSDHLLSFHFHEHLQHLEVDATSDSVFVGATNRLYHLDRNLHPLQDARTGPLLDNVRCTEAFGENPCSGGGAARSEATLTNNVNKVLVVDRSNHQLITCGSVHQGICQTRSLANITAMKEHYSHGNTDYFIAANDPELSTVAFVGPGPGGRDVLYVAATYTGAMSTSVRQTVPAVSSRNLVGSSAFRFAFMDGLTGGTFVRLRREAIEKYLISYVAGFSVGGYSYFLTTQPETFSMENSGFLPKASSRFASKIVQVCQNDRTFHSYVEMPIECQANGNRYSRIRSATIVRPASDLAKRLRLSVTDHVLLATFVKSLQDYDEEDDDEEEGKREEEGGESSDSALCLFRLVDVRQRFTQNIQKCFSGHQKHVGSQFTSRLCVSLGMNLNSSYCGEAEQNGPLVGTISLESVPLKEFPGIQLTSIAATTTGDHTVLFLGTSQGHIKKILLEGDGSIWEYEDMVLQDGFEIGSDLKFNSKRSHLYAMTKSKVFKLALSNCKRYVTCEDCRLAKDPFCGWCSLEKKCSAKSACLHSGEDNRWLSHRSWECIRIPSKFVNPVQIGVKKSTQVVIGIKALPVLRDGDQYLCVLGSNLSVSVGLTAPNEIKCQTPKLDRLSGVEAHADHANVTLSIQSTQTGISFLETVLTFYDCDRHRSCTSCSQSSWDCYWCISRNSCLQADDIPTCPDVVISEQDLCPRLQYVASGQILIPSSVPHQISLAALFLPQTSKAGDGGYECLIHLTSPPIRIPARRLSVSALICSTYQYSYEAVEPTKTFSLEVTWNGGHYIDDNYGITVTVYRCDVMASDCSSCLSLQEMSDTVRYGCQWCADRCQSNSTCGHLQTSSMCPLPDIQEVYPLSGTLEGGTLVTIKGINLGRNYEQVRHAVQVAGVPCETVGSEYVISKLIVCKTGHVTAFHRGSIVVTVGDATVSWETEFTYQNPQVMKMFPVVGPKAGGTKVTFEGHHLDTGAVIRVLLDFKPCHVDFVNSTRLVCTTAPMTGASFCPVIVKFDDSIRRMQTEFEFMENPSISDIRPLSTFMSGGRVITVTGANFDSVQHPIMHLHKRSSTYSSKCIRKSNSILLCPSPFLTRASSDWKHRRSLPTDCTISFTMDNVESVRYVAVHFPDVKSTLEVHPDPVYYSFEDGLKLYKGEALILTGLNLNLACDAEEVKVWIGNETCKVNSIDLLTLYCTPPVIQPPHLGTDGLLDPNSLPLVKVVVGNLLYTLGHLEYQKVATDDSEYWIIGVAFGGGTLLTIIFVILIVYKRKSTNAERQFKKLNLQLDALEINIRNECKQAFAELQTEVSDFTSDLNLIGIPFWDYTNFTYKVLFPTDSACSAVLSGVRKESKFDGGWSKFSDLFYNQHFVIVFVRTLEEQKNFTIRDKAKVASLLMIVFHDRLDYATQVLKVLLGDLIDRSVERKHPKLMLRRTESVVEKMLTNWLSMCLYGYIKTRAGKALFMLYKAIKHQTEKGPIDAITSDARYSLSEDRLLREKTESKALTIYLIPSQESVEPICCRMLDCDIITQAKEKALDAIYMNTPFSRRPSVEQVDLEWLSSPCGRVILRDEDVATRTVRGWKRLNTLAHCQVPDGATMALVARQNKIDTSCLFNDLPKAPVNVSNTILATEENSRHFHLVSPEEGQHIGRSQKVVSEIFLTRLLATKCTLQQYVDDLFSTILTPDTSSLSAVKYLFDFLDAAAQRHGITDAEVLHTWKCNSLLLRFWVNIIKNPEFVFDIHKSPIVDSCLSIIAQTFMDSCSTQDQRLGKDSPSTKLLYAKDIPRYRHLVTQFYKGMNDMPSVDDNRMTQIMTEHSKANSANFNVEFALQELFQYTKQYNLELLEALEDDPSARKEQVSKAYEQVSTSIQGFGCI